MEVISITVFDTNAIIYYLKKEPSVVSVFNEVFSLQPRPYIASVTELELLSSPALTPVEITEIDALLATLFVISLDSHIARKAAELRRVYRIKTPDSIIAATALFTNSTLLTRNARDFKKISGLSVQAI